MKTLFILFLSVVVASQVVAAPRFETFVLNPSGKTKLETKVTAGRKWSTIEDNVRVFSLQAAIQSPEFLQYRSVRSLLNQARASLKEGTLTFTLNSVTEEFELFNGNKRLKIQVTAVNPGESPVFSENCESQFLFLKPESKRVPFYLGISCSKTESGIGVSVSTPKDVAFSSSSLFETKGKGEPWRFYDLGPLKTSQELVGKFSFGFQGREYPFLLFNKKSNNNSPKVTDEETKISFILGAGAAMLKIKGDDIDVASTAPVLAIRSPHFPLVGNLGVNSDVLAGLPMSKGEKNIDFFQFGGFLNYRFKLGSPLYLRPKAGFVVSSITHSTSGIGLSSTAPGFGATFDWWVKPNYLVILDAMTCGIGVKSTKSHYSVDLHLIYKKPESMGYGLGVKAQSFTGESDLGISRQFSSHLFYLLLAF